MERDQRALVVLESRVWVPLVNDALIRELLVVVADLYRENAWVFDPIIGYHQLTMVIDLRRKLVGAQPQFQPTYTRLP